MQEKISIEDLFKIIKRQLLRIVAWGLVGLILSGLHTYYIATPMYESTAKIVVNQTQTNNQVLTDYDIQTNLNLINTYQGLIKEPIILQDVILAAGYDELTIEDLSEKISFQTSNYSLIFGISVLDDNPNRAAELANLTADVFRRKVRSVLEVNSVHILSEAVPKFQPVAPHTTFNLGIGMIAGLMFGMGLAFLMEFSDRRVKNKQIIDELGWTNLGTVLEMSRQEVSNSRKSAPQVLPMKAPSLLEKKA